MRKFTCSKMAKKFFLWFLSCVICGVIVSFIVEGLFLKIVGFIGCSFFSVIAASIGSGYRLSMFRAFIVVKVDNEGVSNCFCKLKWEEVVCIRIERLIIKKRIVYKKRLRYLTGDFGEVALLTSQKSEINKKFKNYSLRKTICVPFYGVLENAIEQLHQQGITLIGKTGDGGLS